MNWLWEPLSDSLIFYLCVMLLLPAVILEWLLVVVVVVVVVVVASCLAQGMKEVLVDASCRRHAELKGCMRACCVGATAAENFHCVDGRECTCS